MVKYEVIDDLNKLPQFETKYPTFADIETENLYTGVRLVQLYQPQISDVVYIIDIDEVDLQEVKQLIKPLWTIWYNASYDFGTLNMVTEEFDDLMYLTKMAYPEFQQYNLDKVVNKLNLGNLYEGLDKKALQKSGFVRGAYLSQDQLLYSATDVYALSLMWNNKKIQEARKIIAYKVDIKSLRYAIRYQQNGLLVDRNMLHEMIKDVEETIKKLKPEFPEGFNPNSYKQVRAYFNITESNYEALVKLAQSDHPKADKAAKLIQLKKALKELSYAKSIDFDRMITKFNVYGAATGRFSSSGGDLPNGFNAQQIPRKFQPLFKQPAKVIYTDNGIYPSEDGVDSVVIDLDYSTLELRLACTIFGESKMYEELKLGKDLHTEMAMLVTGKKIHPEKGILGSDYDTIRDATTSKSNWITKTDRTLAKSINFGYVFGMSYRTYQNYAYVNYGVKLTEKEAKELRDKYFEKYPMFAKYHKYVWNNYKKPSFVYKTALGRPVKPKTGTEGINGPVQGSGAETTKLAVHYLVKEYPDVLKYIINVVHDAIYLRVPINVKDVWKDRLRKAMIKGWEEISKSELFTFNDIPMPVD